MKKPADPNRLRPKKFLGQNFLVDKEIANNIVDKSGIGNNDIVIEIGPGTGVLTRVLIKQAFKVVAVEIDKGLAEKVSKELAEFKNIEIIHKDFLKFDIACIARKYKRKVKVIGNIPFYITTPIIIHCIEEKDSISCLIFGVQKEVADRLLANPGVKDYGSITCYANYFTKISVLQKISRGSFRPLPKVDAAVIRMDIREKPAVDVKDEKLFFKLIRASFNQRRKTILNSLQKAGFKKEILETVLKNAGIEATRRGETLNLGEFADIANALIDPAASSQGQSGVKRRIDKLA